MESFNIKKVSSKKEPLQIKKFFYIGDILKQQDVD